MEEQKAIQKGAVKEKGYCNQKQKLAPMKNSKRLKRKLKTHVGNKKINGKQEKALQSNR